MREIVKESSKLMFAIIRLIGIIIFLGFAIKALIETIIGII